MQPLQDISETVDILVNNCGGPTPGLFQQLEEEDWNSCIRTGTS